MLSQIKPDYCIILMSREQRNRDYTSNYSHSHKAEGSIYS